MIIMTSDRITQKYLLKKLPPVLLEGNRQIISAIPVSATTRPNRIYRFSPERIQPSSIYTSPSFPP